MVGFCMVKETIFNEIIEFFKVFIPPCPHRTNICVAVSGGSDSVALFFILSELRERLGIFRLGIAHVNHGLRGAESDADADFVRDIATRAKAAFHKKLLDSAPNTGIEEWARKERYEFFSFLRQSESYDYVATGHTSDDQAETVIMRIIRGCGLKGLRAVAPVRENYIIRPLLGLTKQALRNWLLETNRCFREDSSNADTSYRRNMVRHYLLPNLVTVEPSARTLLPRIAAAATEVWCLLSSSINKWIISSVFDTVEPEFKILSSAFVDFPFIHEAVAEVLRQKRIPFEKRHVDQIVFNAPRKTGIFLLKGGWRYRCCSEKMEFFQGKNCRKDDSSDWRYEVIPDSSLYCGEAGVVIKNVRISLPIGKPIHYPMDNMTVFLDDAACKESLDFRRLKRDDVFQPLGCGRKRNAKEFLKKRKKHDIRGVVAKKDGEIIWIPGVEIGCDFRVTSATLAIRKFSCKYI